MEEEQDLLTAREMAKQLRCDESTIRRWVKLGILDVIVLPHRGQRKVYRFRRSTLDALLAGSGKKQQEG